MMTSHPHIKNHSVVSLVSTISKERKKTTGMIGFDECETLTLGTRSRRVR